MSKEYLLFLAIDPCKLGAGYPAGTLLPLHCTVMHWFAFRDGHTFSSLHENLVRMVRRKNPAWIGLNMVSKEPELFGPNDDVPVHVLERNDALFALHARIFRILEPCATHTERRWIGANWRPHVATTTHEFPPGTEYTPRYLMAAERTEDGLKKIVGLYVLPAKR